MHAQDALLFAAQHGQNAVRRGFRQQFLSFIVDTVFLVLVNLVGNQTGGDAAVAQECLAQAVAQSGVLADEFRDDVARPGQSFFGRRHALLLADEAGGLALQIELPLRQQNFGQRLQTFLHRHRSAGLAFGAVRQIQILQDAHRVGLLYLLAQFRGQFALFGDGIQDGGAAFVQIQPLGIQVFDIADLHLIQRTGGLLAVAGDERNRRAGLQQVQRVPHLLLGKVQCLRNP